MMRKRILTILAAMTAVVSASAEEYKYNILHEVDTIIDTKLAGITIGSREIRHFVYEFPSTDADRQPVMISSVIMVPKEIVEGRVPCDGIVLYNHYTAENPDEVPSKGGLYAESVLLANPLKPNYIVVSCDNIGYGSSIDRPVAFMCGDINARNALDGLLAARQILEDEQIAQGKYLFNIGYSQGGSDAMYCAKLRDMEYKDKISFTKTYAGGGVMDCELAFTEMIKGDAWDSLKHIMMMLISMNENYHLGIDYKDLFYEPLASSVEKVLVTKNMADLNMEGIDSLHQAIQPAYLSPDSAQYKTLKTLLSEIKITNGWTPDPTQQYFYAHTRHDNYVPIQSGRSIITFLKKNGYKPSIVPGKTNLQTSMLLFKLNHHASAYIWAVQTMAAIQYWPTVYYDGEQNTYYHSVVHDLTLMKVVKFLESLGIDLRKMIAQSANRSQAMRRADFFTELTKVLDTLGLTLTDALEMLDDSGIGLDQILEVYMYLTTKAANNVDAIEEAEQRTQAPLYLMRYYEQTLSDWFKLAGHDAGYEQWGW